MTIRLSTGLGNALLAGGTTGGIKGAFGGGVVAYIAIFQGAQPTDADTGSGSAILLGTVTNNDDGSTTIAFDAPVLDIISKAAAGVWKFHGLGAGGTAGWFRFYQTGDTYTATSTTAVRLDGSIGTSGADMNISNTAIVTAAQTTIDSFTIQMPKF